jgi:hypothetical protein
LRNQTPRVYRAWGVEAANDGNSPAVCRSVRTDEYDQVSPYSRGTER